MAKNQEGPILFRMRTVKYLRICLEVEAGVAQIFAYLDQCTNRKHNINANSNTNINTNTTTDIFLHSSDLTTQLNRERVLAHFLSPDFRSLKSNSFQVS